MGDLAQDFVTTTLNYFIPPTDGSAPWAIAQPTTGQLQKNWETRAFEVQVENLRGREDSVSLDKTGFAFRAAPSAVPYEVFEDDAAVQARYYPESEALLKKLTGATRVVFFDHTIRRHRPGEVGGDPQKRQPVFQVHVDQTPAAARRRVERHLPADEVDGLLARRFQIVNLWRPIGHPAAEQPLAVCDFRSISPEDLVPLRLEFPTYTGETFSVRHNPAHRWKYVRALRPDEVILVKCHDSEENVAQLTPHTAFVDPTTPADAPHRESIELRALLFY